MPAIKAHFLDGHALPPEYFAGRPWVVNLFLPTCGVCAREFRDLEVVRAEFEPQGVGFVAISLDPDEPTVRAAIQRLGLGMRAAIADDEILGPLGVAATPSTVFLARDGTIVAAANGRRDADFFRRRIRELLASNK